MLPFGYTTKSDGGLPTRLDAPSSQSYSDTGSLSVMN